MTKNEEPMFDKNTDLYACILVKDYTAALAWYERLFGCPPSFVASDTEAVWELAEHRSITIEQRPERAGHTVVTVFLTNFDALTSQISKRGVESAKRENYGNGVREAVYHDPEGNEIRFGGAPIDQK